MAQALNVTGMKSETKVVWRPRKIALNGLALTLFGGYVNIESLAYGGAAVTTGAPGTLTLDRLHEYRPLPAKGRMVITKNGAVRYEGMQ